MDQRAFGRTGLTVPALGFGAMQLGDPRLHEDEAADVLNGVLDLGLTLVDTARSYGLSEERIGRHLARRRDEFVLSTKVGYGVDGVRDWTYECVMAGVDAARNRLRTDVIDVVHLHSCDIGLLRAGEVSRALERCRELGKLRVAAYSGDDAALGFAIESGAFGSVQASVNLCDQQSLEALPNAQRRRLGTIAKRPLAGRPWAGSRPSLDAAESEYHRRFRALREAGLAPDFADWDAAALRFAAYAPGVDCVIVGGTRLRHLEKNAAAVSSGPLGPEQEAAIRRAFAAVGTDWRGLI
ncbi:MAG: aldo/keto reductase [Gammaproteobacteria bacterium]|nr:aldo/keto reductase [Gammaproteobacteria bacterium]